MVKRDVGRKRFVGHGYVDELCERTRIDVCTYGIGWSERQERRVRSHLVFRGDSLRRISRRTKAHLVIIALERRLRAGRAAADRDWIAAVCHRIDCSSGTKRAVRVDTDRRSIEDKRQMHPFLLDRPDIHVDILSAAAEDSHLCTMPFGSFKVPLNMPAVAFARRVFAGDDPVPAVDELLLEPARHRKFVAECACRNKQPVVHAAVIAGLVAPTFPDHAVFQDHLIRRVADSRVACRHCVASVPGNVRLSRRSRRIHVPDASVAAPNIGGGSGA